MGTKTTKTTRFPNDHNNRLILHLNMDMKIKNNAKCEKHSFKQNFITMKYENMKRIELRCKIIL
jgi:hypothetical protein